MEEVSRDAQSSQTPWLTLEQSQNPVAQKKFLRDYRAFLGKKNKAAAVQKGRVEKPKIKQFIAAEVREQWLQTGAVKRSNGQSILTDDDLSSNAIYRHLSAPEHVSFSWSSVRSLVHYLVWRTDCSHRKALDVLAAEIQDVLSRAGHHEVFKLGSNELHFVLKALKDKIGVPQLREEIRVAVAGLTQEDQKDWEQVLSAARHVADEFDSSHKGGQVQKEALYHKGDLLSKKTMPYCLNKRTCPRERHFVNQCPHTSPEEKKTLLEKHREKIQLRKQEFSRKKTERIQAIRRAEMSRSCTKFFLEGMLVDGEADSGSSVTIVPASLITKLRARGVELEESNLSTPRRYTVANGEASVLVNKKVKVPVLSLQQDGGTVVDLKNVQLFVSNEVEMLLLGRQLLNSLGFNFSSFLRKNADRLHNIDLAGVEPEEMDANPASCHSLDILEEFDDELLPDIMLPNDDVDHDQEFEQMLERAKGQMTSQEGYAELEQIVRQYRDVFYSGFSDKPADLPPMRLQLKPDCRSIRTPVRRYKPEQRAFMEETIEKLVGKGLLQKVESADWLSAPHLVDKPTANGMTYRFTVDLRAVNHATMPEQSAVPTVEEEVTKVAGAKFFTNFDLANCFWQVPLEESARKHHTIVAPSGLYAPTRVLHGAKNASIHTERVLAHAFAAVQDSLAVYLDDHLLFSRTKEGWLKVVEQYLRICRQRGLKLSPKKAELYATEVKWVGRRITKEGILYEPRKLQTLQNMPLPQNGAELQQLLSAANWMRLSIPNYTNLVRPLQTALHALIRQAGSSKQSVLRSYDVTLGDEEVQAFQALKQHLLNRTRMSHFDPEDSTRQLVLHTDASQYGWAGVLTTIPVEDKEKSHKDQRHEPIAFVSGKFNETQARWSTIEQEAYAILASMERCRAWTLAATTRIVTDSRNVMHLWKPIPAAVQNRLGLTTVAVNKMARWGLKLSAFDYTIEHLEGSENHMADLLSRWGQARRTDIKVLRLNTVLSREQFGEQLFEAVREAQRLHGSPRANGVRALRHYVPVQAQELINRIMVLGHGTIEHRSCRSTKASIKDVFVWTDMDLMIEDFCQKCILCAKTRAGDRVPRPLGNLSVGEFPNDLIHFDYLYLDEGRYSYLLLIKDDFTGYCMLHRARAADADTTAEGLAAWISLFGVPKMFHSDTGSHFKNKTMRALSNALGVDHSFAVAYSPWSNGTVERLCRSVLDVFRKICSKNGKAYKEWDLYSQAVQRVLNTRLVEKLGYRSPASVFTNARDINKNLSVLLEDDAQVRAVQVGDYVQEEITRMENHFDSFHKGLFEKLSESRRKKVLAYNAKTHIEETNFDVGDFVLVGIAQPQKRSKLCLRWTGPARIVELDEHHSSFQVQFLGETKVMRVHSTRLRHYADADLEVTEELEEHVEQEKETFYDVDEVLEVRFQDGKWEFQVAWSGFDETTWEPAEKIYADCIDMCDRFIAKMKGKKKKQLRKFLKV